MKVLRVIETFLPNITGPVNQAYRLSLELEKRNIHSPVITTYYNTKNAPNEEHIDLVSVQRLKYLRIMQYCISPQLKKALKKSQQEEKIDIIHAHTYRSYQTEIAAKFARKQKIPFVLSTHGSLLGYDNYLKNNLVKLPYQFYDLLTAKKAALLADAIIVNSKQEYQEALSFGIQKEKLHLIPVGIDVSLYEQKSSGDKENILNKRTKIISKDKIRLLFVARISRNRNLELLINAVAILQQKLEQQELINKKSKNQITQKIIKGLPKIELRIVGKEIINSATDKLNYLEEMKQLAKKLSVDTMITFVGEKEGNELINEYKNADIFVYTSLSENFGQPILEAAATGLPLLTPKIGVAAELIIPSKTGYFIDYNPIDLAEKIMLLFNKQKREIMGENIQKIVKQNYAWDSIISEYNEIYNLLLKNKKVK